MLSHTLELFEHSVESDFHAVLINRERKYEYIRGICKTPASPIRAKVRWVRGTAKLEQPRIEHHERQPFNQNLAISCQRFAVTGRNRAY